MVAQRISVPPVIGKWGKTDFKQPEFHLDYLFLFDDNRSECTQGSFQSIGVTQCYDKQ